jgi:hypothetical protein
MTRANARRVNDTLVQFMTKSMEGVDQVQGKEPKFMLTIQVHDQGVTHGLASPFYCFIVIQV